MSRLLRYLSHPQVQIDANIPVPDWGLSDIGRTRTLAIGKRASLDKTMAIVSSAEKKAVETAEIVASFLSIKPTQIAAMHENDRSATGFLPPDEFERIADLFFKHPKKSIKGWERAIDAQARIVSETRALCNRQTSGDILVVGHGGVGTLLYAHFANKPISRIYDQPAGGGNFFTVSLESFRPLHGWLSMEQI